MASDLTFIIHPSPELSAICERINAGHQVNRDTVLFVLEGIGKPTKITLGDVLNGHVVSECISNVPATAYQKLGECDMTVNGPVDPFSPNVNVRIDCVIDDPSDPQRVYADTRRAIWDATHPEGK